MKFLAILVLGWFALVSPAQEADEAQPPVRFTTVDVVLDSGTASLAAWQIEVEDPARRAKVVGIEGGAHAAFREPARYDPRALATGRIVLAAFTLDDDVPVGATRVATLHLEVSGEEPVHLTCEVQAAADPTGREIAPQVEIVPTPTNREDR